MVDYERSALVIVDPQQGFSSLCPEELPIPDALGIVGPCNTLLSLPFARKDVTLDWHPPDHCSFSEGIDRNGRAGSYPPHCVAGTPGADFLPGLRHDLFGAVFRKGIPRDKDHYAFTSLHKGVFALYKAEGIDTVVIGGLARNICCAYTAKDFRKHGFRVLLVEEAMRGIDVPEAGLMIADMDHELKELGIEFVGLSSFRRPVI